MKLIGLILTVCMIFSVLSCNNQPRKTKRERIEWINDHVVELNKAIALFDECAIRKVVWSDDRFITLISNDDVCYNAYLDKKFSPIGTDMPAFVEWPTVSHFYEFSKKLEINGIARGIGTYVSFQDKSCLLVVDGTKEYNIFSLTRRQPFTQVKEGWFLFVDIY